MTEEQKFKKGDLVHIAKDLGQGMGHFESDCDVIVAYSYKEQYGHGSPNSYGLFFRGQGTVSWYYDNQLTLIEANRLDLLQQWEDELNALKMQKSDLDWVFANGAEIAKNPNSYSMTALASCMDINLWGVHGEGFAYAHNSRILLVVADHYLLNNDKEGWLELCQNMKNQEIGLSGLIHQS